jgi:LEA14-like dessication related protein
MRTPSFVVLAGVLTGCAQLRFEPPTTALAAVQVAGIGLEGGTLRLQLDVHNPNTYELRTTRIAMGVELESTNFGNVEVTQPLRLPAGETTRVEVPLNFRWAGLGAGARALLSRGAVRYALEGRLFVDTPLGGREIPVRASGETSLMDVVR